MGQSMKNKTLGEVCRDRHNNFDFIRFLAASLVIYSHAIPLSAGNEGEFLKDLTDGKWSFGSLSVAVFFVISGFLIAQSYDRSKNPVQYIKARALRIFPGLICVLILSVFVLGPLFTTLPVGTYFRTPQTYEYLKSVFLYPLYWNLPGVFEHNTYSPSVNGSLWTIPHEVLFYGLILLLGITKLLQKKKINIALFLSFFILECYKYQLFPGGGNFLSLPKYDVIELGLYFSAGMMLYALRDYVVLDKQMAMIALAALVIFILNGAYAIPFAVFGSYLVMYAAFSNRVRLYGFSKYGDFSYGIYIYGFPVQQAVVAQFGGSMNPYLNMMISYPITVVLAILSWKFVEKPCIKLKSVQFFHGNFFGANALAKLDSAYEKVLNRVERFGWKTFIAVFAVVLIGVNEWYTAPNIVTFPYNGSETIFLSGWVDQSQNEEYRWVRQDSSIELMFPKGASNIMLKAFVPENFTEINQLTIRINGDVVNTTPITAGNQIDILQDISNLALAEENIAVVELQFNAEHIPGEDELDQRIMSALINQIGFF